MKSKLIEINVIDYISPRTRVNLDSDFRIKLFTTAIVGAGTKRKLAKIIDVNETSLYEWKIGKKTPPLDKVLKCSEIAQIDEDTLLKNICNVTSWGRQAGCISIKNWKLVLNEKLIEWLGLLRGDGTITKYYVSLSNNCVPVIFFFAEVLEEIFGISRRRMEIIVRLPTDKKQEKVRKIVQLLSNKGFKKTKFETEKSHRFERREPNIVLRVSSRILVQLISNLMLNLHELIKKLSKKIKISYVRGFLAAEGSVYVCRGQRGISVSQKYPEELEFIKSLLADVGITHISYPIPIRDKFQIVITTRKEIENFRKLIGFGSHTVKNKQLDSVLSTYRKDLPYKTPKKVRYKNILQILKNKKKASCSIIANSLKLKPRYVNILLNEMLERNLMSVERDKIPFIYILGDKSG